MDSLLASFLNLLNLAVTSHLGTVIAAAALALVVWAVQKVPAVETFVASNAKLETLATLFLAVAPAVITTLSSTGATWSEALMTAVSTFLMAVGAKAALAKLTA